MKYNNRPNLLRKRKTNSSKQANNDRSLAWDTHIKYVTGLNRLLSAQIIDLLDKTTIKQTIKISWNGFNFENKYNNNENKIQQEVPTSCQFYVVEQYKDKDDFVADKSFIVSEIKFCINN